MTPYFNIYCWRVNHGEGTILTFDDYSIAHIVDFGTTQPNSHFVHNAVREAHFLLHLYSHIDAVITHLHYDHYSLIPYIVHEIQNIYLPGIPKPEKIREMVTYMLALSIEMIRRLPGSRIINIIAEEARFVHFVFRNQRIPISNKLYARVIWPPPELPHPLAEKAQKKLKPLYEKSKELAKKLGIEKEVKETQEKIYSHITASEREQRQQSLNDVLLIPISIQLPPDISEFLTSFRDAVNDLSLVVKYYDEEHDRSLALIPGDVSNDVLDYIAQLESFELKKPKMKDVMFLRGAHHGTHYGKYLEEHRAIVTWLSWTKSMKSQPNTGYLYRTATLITAENAKKAHMEFYYGKHTTRIHMHVKPSH